jgi:polyphosphate glucokinase
MRACRRSSLALAVDVGGTGTKAALVTPDGRLASRVRRVPTPCRATPARILDLIADLARELSGHEFVGVGFPGVVRAGTVWTAPNLAARSWCGVPFERELRNRLGCPVYVANDAVVHGLGAVSGRGVELMLTLGTGLGGALYVDGMPLPLEPGHLPWKGQRTIERWIGEAGRRRLGTHRWRRIVREVVDALSAALQPDRVLLGGGNARWLAGRLGPGVRCVGNDAGLRGAARLVLPSVRAHLARKMKKTAPAMQSAAQR